MNFEYIISRLKLPIPFLYGETMSYDRWRWITKRLPKEPKGKKIADLGCGRGTYVFSAAQKGFFSLGVTYDESDVIESNLRRERFGIKNCLFKKIDLRKLDREKGLKDNFDVVLCCEVMEHIIGDEKLIKDISLILRKGGVLMLTTPYYNNSHNEREPLSGIAEGGHVRLGYNQIALKKILEENNFELKEVNYCSGLISQKSKIILKIMSKRNYILGRVLILPIKLISFVFDKGVTKGLGKEFASICVMAKKK